MSISLTELNHLEQDEFVRLVGPLFEHSPWIAEKTWPARPFETRAALHAALTRTLDAAPDEAKVALIRAHPDLAGKLAIAGELTDHSSAEQKSARLNQLTPEQFSRITALNDRYRAKFGFPFVICVKDHTQQSIFAEFERRVELDRAGEIAAALHNIQRIAWHRLMALVETPS